MERQLQERIFELENKIAELNERCDLARKEIKEMAMGEDAVEEELMRIKEWKKKVKLLQNTLDTNKKLYSIVYQKFIL